jgi:deoxyribose-phosphate aldolase
VNVAARALPLVDLTSLTGEEDDAAIAALCAQALTPAGPVAAVCLYPRYVARARAELAGAPVRIAAVANFPEGDPDPERARRDAGEAVQAGADEVDVVLPWRAWREGDLPAALAVVEAARQATPGTLKVILESGRLGTAEVIAAAAASVLEAGADFVKTSTGKLQPGATPEAARAMLTAVRAAGRGGFKASGGVRTAEQAGEYLALADELLGPGWAAPATFRFGASGLLADLLERLGHGAAATGETGY